ncbi:hypothetical protein CUT44_21430 [Streptomyces carminius]|uniref:Uncharacterized protein n=1 Tax=Streptomyces carminius TaxID=2665496 RepID=A0A2M8LV41_9ACTN|nr:hypothetical protein [Streptomyces carminius]PJE95817.1 hypothetical protein CUT44_21430 [Streptomyces carminius]
MTITARRLFVRWARAADGTVVTVEAGGCSEGFPKLAPYLAPHARTASVGASRWTVLPLREALDAASAAIAADPELTRCAEPGCLRCEHAIAGGPLGEDRPG